MPAFQESLSSNLFQTELELQTQDVDLSQDEAVSREQPSKTFSQRAECTEPAQTFNASIATLSRPIGRVSKRAKAPRSRLLQSLTGSHDLSQQSDWDHQLQISVRDRLLVETDEYAQDGRPPRRGRPPERGIPSCAVCTIRKKKVCIHISIQFASH